MTAQHHVQAALCASMCGFDTASDAQLQHRALTNNGGSLQHLRVAGVSWCFKSMRMQQFWLPVQHLGLQCARFESVSLAHAMHVSWQPVPVNNDVGADADTGADAGAALPAELTRFVLLLLLPPPPLVPTGSRSCVTMCWRGVMPWVVAQARARTRRQP
jgi:hypothetical protein